MQRIVLFSAKGIVLFSAVGLLGLSRVRTVDAARVPTGPAIQDSLTSILAGFKAETGTGTASLKVACPDRYFQVQVEVRGDTEVFCGMSMNENDLVPFPILMCAGTSKSEPSRRGGVTLHRKPL